MLEQFKYRITSKIKPEFHTHAKYEIYYFHSGKCSYWIGGKSIDLIPGDLIIMNGIREHGPVIDESFEYVRTTILFDGTGIASYPLFPVAFDVLKPFLVSTHDHWRLQGEWKDELEELLGRMDKFHRMEGPIALNRFRLAFLDLLLFIYERFLETEHAGKELPNSKEKLVLDAVHYFENHYTEDISLDELADHLHVSRTYLMRIFKQFTGETMIDYLHGRRIRQAEALFRIDPTRSVTEVCYGTGFKHLSHFSRTFKRIVGLTPEQYRKLLIRNNV